MASTLKVFSRAALSAIKKPKPGPVPQRTVTRTVKVDPQAVARFNTVTQLPVNNRVTAPYLHTLGFNAGLELMTEPDFPLPALGMVHVYNRFTQHAPVPMGAEVTLEISLSQPRARGKGTEIDIIVKGSVNGQLAFEDVSTCLAKTASLPEVQEEAPKRRLELPEGPIIAQWNMPAGLGERYARVSGDYNLIHLNNLAAKAFGFPRAIAHGMYTASRAFGQSDVQADAFVWDVQFAKPILLPSRVGVVVDRSDSVRVGVVRHKDRAPHLISDVRVM